MGGRVMNRRSTFCDGLARRDFLRLGGAGLFGLGLTLSGILAGQARAAAGHRHAPRRDVSLIYLFLHGGLSTIDTWDMKPDAPAEFRGEFKPIRTNVPGIDMCEHLPHMAAGDGQGLADPLVPAPQLRSRRRPTTTC